MRWEETSPDSRHRCPGQFYSATTARYARLWLWLFRGRYGADLCECQPNLPRYFLTLALRSSKCSTGAPCRTARRTVEGSFLIENDAHRDRLQDRLQAALGIKCPHEGRFF